MNTDLSVLYAKMKNNEWFSLATILFGPALIVIDIFIVNVAIPSISQYYHSTTAEVQLMVASYLIGFTIFLITGGRAGDRYGRKKMFCFGIAAFTISSALCGWSATITQLIIFRFVQGVSAAFTMPAANTMMHLSFPSGKKRDQAYGLYGIISGLAAVLGQLLGGYFVSLHQIPGSWRLIFLINLPIGVLALLAALMFLKESKDGNKTRFDPGGIIVLVFALSGLIFPLTRGRELGFPGWSIIMLACSILVLLFFFKNQHRKTRANLIPLINTNLFSIKTFNMGLLSLVFFYGVHNGFLLNCALFLQNGYGFSSIASGFFFAIFGVGFIASSIWSMSNSARYGIRMLQSGTMLMLCSFIGQWFIFRRETPSPVNISALMFVYGLGNGLVLPSILRVSLQGINHRLAGTATGVYSTVQQLSSALGVSIISGIFLSIAEQSSGYINAYRISLLVMCIYLVVLVSILHMMHKLIAQKRNPTPAASIEEG
jgi:MFS family permease